ncbi:MAG: hypothetical protein V1729_02585 [Candidatus Woesearchaeota archaeon]
MSLRQFPRILKRLHNDKRAIVPILAAAARGLAVAGKAAGQVAVKGAVAAGRVAAKGAASAGRVAAKGAASAGHAVGRIGSSIGKGAAKTGQAAGQTAVKTEQVAAGAAVGGATGAAAGSAMSSSAGMASRAAPVASAEAKFSQTVTEKLSSLNKQLGQAGMTSGGLPGQGTSENIDARFKQDTAEAVAEEQRRVEANRKEDDARAKAQVEASQAAAKAQSTMTSGGGNAGFAQKALEQGSGKSPNIAATIATVAGILVSLLTFNSSGMSGLLKVLPFVLFLISMVMIIFSMGKSVPGWVLLIATSAYWIYSSSGMAGLPALVPLFLVLIGIIILDKTKEHRGTGVWLALVVIFTLAFYMFMVYTAPYAMAAISEAGGITQVVSASAEETSKVGSKGIAGLIENTVKSYNKQKAAATGQRVEGDVDTKAQIDAKIELLDDFLENPKNVRDNLLDFLEMRARVMAFDAKTEIHVAVTCHLQSEEEAADWRRTYSTAKAGGLNKNPGLSQKVEPGEITGQDFTKKIICTPDIVAYNKARNEATNCGNYIVSIFAQADHLRTDAQLQNYIINEDTYEQALYNYAEAKDETLSYNERLAATQKIFPEVEGYKSKSYIGPIKVTMSTLQAPLIPISERGTNLALTVAIENNAAGWIRGVNDLEITIPSSLSPRIDACKGWTVEGNKLVASESYLKTVDFEAVPKGQQAVFPSCPLIPADVSGLTEPAQVEFLAMVDYNYIVQKPYNLEVLNETGGKCVKKKTTTARV